MVHTNTFTCILLKLCSVHCCTAGQVILVTTNYLHGVRVGMLQSRTSVHLLFTHLNTSLCLFAYHIHHSSMLSNECVMQKGHGFQCNIGNTASTSCLQRIQLTGSLHHHSLENVCVKDRLMVIKFILYNVKSFIRLLRC